MAVQTKSLGSFSVKEYEEAIDMGKPMDVPVEDIREFKDHTFRVVEDEEMKKLKSSIEEHGIITPVIAFRNEEGETELIAGHRRLYVARQIGMETIPVIYKEVNRDEATILMGETNLMQRERILLIDKAFTLKAMLEALKRLPGRPRKDDPMEQENKGKVSRDVLAERVGESPAQVQRYIRLTELIPELRALVDIGRIGFRPAVEISYLPDTYQKVIFEYYQANDVTPSYAQALEMHTLDSKDQLNERKIERILEEMKGNQLAAENKLVFHSPAISKLLRNCTSQKEREEKVIRALQLLDAQEKQKKQQKRVTAEVASL